MNIITKSWRALKDVEARQIANREKKHEAAKCPNCGQYKLTTMRSKLVAVAFACFLTAGILTIFIITIPLALIVLAVGVIILIIAPFAKGHFCENCHFKTAG